MEPIEIYEGEVYHDAEDKFVHFKSWPRDRPDIISEILWSRESAKKLATALLKVVALADEDYNNRWEE